MHSKEGQKARLLNMSNPVKIVKLGKLTKEGKLKEDSFFSGFMKMVGIGLILGLAFVGLLHLLQLLLIR